MLYKLAACFELVVLVMRALTGFVANGVFVLIVIDMALMLPLYINPETQVKLLAAEEFEREYKVWAENRKRTAPPVVPMARRTRSGGAGGQ